MTNANLTPGFLFEVSWEVCNKVGGIHTVVATKAQTAMSKFGDRYMLIGPDFPHEGSNPEFAEDPNLLRAWRQALYGEGIRVRVGRWKIKGEPIVALVDFTSQIPSKDEILKQLWEEYHVDSISGQWDYVEPVLFGWVAGKVIASYAEHFCSSTDKVAAHFHEWMTAAGGLYLRKYAPSVATLFTTHATVVGRCLAGNRLPLYADLAKFNADELARQFNVVAKHSLEKAAATNLDAFLTVSDITARECRHLLGREVDGVTPNGFEDDIVWGGAEYDRKRAEARAALIGTAEACLGAKFSTDPLIVGTSGRYEFRNKGLDLYIESLKQLAASDKLGREVLAYITVPAATLGPRTDLQARLADPTKAVDATQVPFVTHYLEHPAWDPIVNAVSGSSLMTPDSKVRVIFVPTYLNGADGIFDKPYYDLLAGMDVTVYPSYYEPWGYTPLESVAFSVPTVTTTLAGFGLWVDKMPVHTGVEVIRRDDYNDAEAAAKIADALVRFSRLTEDEVAAARASAYEISETALWEHLYAHYEAAYAGAVDSLVARTNRALLDGGSRTEQINFVRQQLFVEKPNWNRLMVEKTLSKRLAALEELSHNLWWCWNSDARDLIEGIDPELWAASDHNPIVFLDRLSTAQIKALEADEEFLSRLDAIYARFCDYMNEKPDPKTTTVSYFSMEYGLHSSLKIYSGGLGILAGDYLKEASDKNVPMTAVGLLYRYGYFTQKLSAQGSQEATYEAQNFFKLPISPVRDEDGSWLTVSIAFPGRTLSARVWKCQVGRTDLYLLDADFEANLEEDRRITHHLYGGDWENRLKQEILLGIGGIRALRKLGIKNQVYHCNEGHAAFIGIERIREMVNHGKLTFSEALEVIRSSSLFTTHTPVPAGHDAFPESMIRQYMAHYPDVLGITWEQYINLGKTNPNDPNEKFSMSVLACNLSQEVNGVSWLHGEVSKEILGNMWPGYFKNELHIGYVTNGVHFPTWIATSLRRLYTRYFPEGFSGHVYNIPEWQKVHNIPDEELWSARMALKHRLVNHIRKRYSDPAQVRLDSPRQMLQIIDGIKPEVLTIGFARRFATYKRAYLLFTNLDRLAAIVNNKERPVQFIFAGKAHPNDKPGQDLIKRIVEVSAMPQFVGKILFLQNYDMELARRMVQGVDVWLNTPTRPLEASGTSGEKCVMNGVMQFSVLDGWWVEGYKEGAGWMLPMERTFAEQRFQDELDAEMIYNTIEDEIAPLYYDRGEDGVPHRWVASVKSCVADIASNFTMNRQLIDYEDRFYNKLAARKAEIVADGYRLAREIAAWKRKVSAAWDKVRVVDVQRVNLDREAVYVGEKYRFEVKLDVANLRCEDLGVEMVVARQIVGGEAVNVTRTIQLHCTAVEGSLATYSLDYTPEDTGTFDVALRVFPQNAHLPHRMDFALVKWA
ncbi:alpha-glucan family phosphorylase [Alistipes sp.]|uniref:alpha-glucan family phosphorylase n=2 Tax=Alistipes TaxID=239759 RepID=UPI000EDF1DBD|nr:alpha-glucan family phosphorylase [Alistipes sp.]HCN14014.1 alpha-glucan family phosphorylase [Alistipes sp.]